MRGGRLAQQGGKWKRKLQPLPASWQEGKGLSFRLLAKNSRPTMLLIREETRFTMRSMQALVKRERGPGLWLEEIPVPTVGEFDVLIRVLRSSAPCATVER